jgi:methyltransferase (TIGR00027 family)
MPASGARFASTAKWIAAARAKESARPDRLFHDPFAAALAGEAGFEILARSEAASGGENAFLPIRTRYFDDLLLNAAAPQVVLLGAGLDTRAYRLPFADVTHVFELDRGEVLEEKERILTAVNARPRCIRRAVAVDLADSWTEHLAAAGFDSAQPSIWIAEGLLFYLSEEHVGSLLRRARFEAAPGSVFAADVFGTGLLDQAPIQPYLRWLESAHLPPPFCTGDPAGLFACCGWGPAKITEPGQPGANYGRMPVRGPGEGSNRAYLVSAPRGSSVPQSGAASTFLRK